MTDLQKQEHLASELDKNIDLLEKKYHLNGYWNHEHICTFEMLCHGNLKNAEKQCKSWRAQHPIQFPKNWYKPHDISDYCDFCDMRNYVAVDDKGRIIYVKRTNPRELIKEFDKR